MKVDRSLSKTMLSNVETFVKKESHGRKYFTSNSVGLNRAFQCKLIWSSLHHHFPVPGKLESNGSNPACAMHRLVYLQFEPTYQDGKRKVHKYQKNTLLCSTCQIYLCPHCYLPWHTYKNIDYDANGKYIVEYLSKNKSIPSINFHRQKEFLLNQAKFNEMVKWTMEKVGDSQEMNEVI